MKSYREENQYLQKKKKIVNNQIKSLKRRLKKLHYQIQRVILLRNKNKSSKYYRFRYIKQINLNKKFNF
ncbi:unnamed protein product [Paramecium sonneborni]|uniref:Uncharacterized protein n=1 Tax=Paramecium sonneborni TaxID=65129 RepID=A0A8S1RS64_9CILI|nr:unnamed protein product [Paramecium sonneborni]